MVRRTLLYLVALLSIPALAVGQSSNLSMNEKMNTDPEINVLELRNYLLKPKTFDRFQSLFSTRFVEPMNELGGFTVGQYKLRKLTVKGTGRN